MVIATVLAVVGSVQFTQTVTAAVTSMSKPEKDTGVYAYWFRFLHALMSVLKNDKTPPPLTGDEQTLPKA